MDAESDDLFLLARIAGYAPVDFYASAKFAGVRISGSEIQALSLKPENLEGAEIVEDDIDSERDTLAKKLMSELLGSGNFSQTHAIVARLMGLNPFSGEAIDLYLDAVENNPQVSWIMGDEDLVMLAAKIDSSPAAHYSLLRLDRLREIRMQHSKT